MSFNNYRSRFIVDPSYASVEDLCFGRIAFHGMNPEIEKMMTNERIRHEEKEALRRRLAELEEGETKSLESSLKEKRLALEKVKVDFRKQREIARAEIFKLEQKIKVLNVLCEYPRIGH